MQFDISKQNARYSKAILERGVDWGYMAKNPAKQVKKPKIVKPELKFLTKVEMDDLIITTPEEHRALIATACYTGMRLGELLGLLWDDVDFSTGKIHARRTLQKGKFQEPKTVGSKRQIHVPAFLLDYLRSQRARQLVEVESNPDNLVFTTSTGRPLDPSNVNKWIFKRALKSVTIKNVRFHDLRHSYASMLIDKVLTYCLCRNSWGTLRLR
jgi:integrase